MKSDANILEFSVCNNQTWEKFCEAMGKGSLIGIYGSQFAVIECRVDESEQKFSRLMEAIKIGSIG